MAEAVRTLIVNGIADQLRTITEANGYTFTVNFVDTVMPNETNLDALDIQPCIFIWGGVEEKSMTEWDGAVQNELDIHIVVSGKTCYAATAKGTEMLADIEQCLLSGTPWDFGGALVDLVPVNTTVAQSDVNEFQPGGYTQYLARYSTFIGNPRSPYNRA